MGHMDDDTPTPTVANTSPNTAVKSIQTTTVKVNVNNDDTDNGNNNGGGTQRDTSFQTTNVVNEVQQEEWFKKTWRPLAAYTYIIIVLFDFLLAPLGLGWYSYYIGAKTVLMWTPLTLQGSGLFHLSFGAILGIYAWGRSKEKIGGVN